VAPGLDEIIECEVIFICVPTDPKPNGTGKCDLRAYEAVVASLGEREAAGSYRIRLIVQRSTCPPGTARAMSCALESTLYAVAPSFLSKNSMLEDAVRPPRLAFAGSVEAVEILEALHQNMECESRFISRSFESVELLKYIENTIDATLISLWNEYLLYADALDIPREEFISLMDAVSGRDRFATTVRVPGQAFGLWCLPKDLAALLEEMRRLDVPGHVLAAVLRTNDEMEQLHGVRSLATNQLLQKKGHRFCPSKDAERALRERCLSSVAAGKRSADSLIE
jgi:UDPglucose 6-dehydrogenase